MLFSKTPTMLLYICFFLVQFSSYYNYVTQSTVSSFSTNTPITANNKTAISKADKNEDRKVNIRLNKRFAPSPILYCEPNFTLTLVSYTTIKKCVIAYVPPFIPSSHLRIKVLRGPPNVVA